MTTPLVLTFVGDDRPGLVSQISQAVAAHGGTWLESRSARLAGKFAGILLVRIPDESVIPLESALAKLAPSGLRVSIDRGAAAEAERPARTVKLEIVGNERPGIVRDVTQAFESPRREHRGIRERPGKGAVHRRRDVPRQSALERPRGPRARRVAQGARAACRRDHGRSQLRRGRGAPLTGALSAACAPAPALP